VIGSTPYIALKIEQIIFLKNFITFRIINSWIHVSNYSDPALYVLALKTSPVSSIKIQKTQQTSEYSYRPAYLMPITHADFGIRSYTLTRNSQSEPRTSHTTGELILLTYLYVAYQIKIRKIQ